MEEREILVSKLYSLRAAISELSIKKDELVDLDRFINNPREELDREKALVEENKEKATMQYSDYCEKENRKIKDLEKSYLESIRKKEMKVSTLSGIVFMVGAALLYYYVLKDLPLIFDLGLVAGIVITIAGGIFGWFVVGLISKMFFKLSCKSKKMNALKKEVDNNTNLYKVKLDAQLLLYNDALMKIEHTNVDTKDAIKKRELLLKVSKILTDKTNDLFSSVLDLRDWKYVDLVIYYLETKRADTIKEALQQIDILKQHEELIDTIEKCAADIVKAIEAAANKLNDTLTRGFNEVTESIKLFAQQQHEDNKMLLESINKVASEMEFQSALMTKASVSSEYLMQDFNYLRDYTLRENW